MESTQEAMLTALNQVRMEEVLEEVVQKVGQGCRCIEISRKQVPGVCVRNPFLEAN
jgi:hypothetical protein